MSTPASSNLDDWPTAVKLLTGYRMPLRDELFDKLLIGNNDIPLFKIEIHDSFATPSNAEADAIDDLAWRTKNSGWRIEDTDFVVPFYAGRDTPDHHLSVG